MQSGQQPLSHSEWLEKDTSETTKTAALQKITSETMKTAAPTNTSSQRHESSAFTMSTSPFLSLPPELRNNIYEYVCHTKPIHWNNRAARRPPARARASHQEPEKRTPERLALLRTCKQISNEARGLVYACNSFVIHSVAASSSWTAQMSTLCDPAAVQISIEEFVKRIGIAHSEAICDLTFIIGTIDIEYIDYTPQRRSSSSSDPVTPRQSLMKVFRGLHDLHLRFPQWCLRVRLDCDIEGDSSYGYFSYRLEVSMRDLETGLGQAIVDFNKRVAAENAKRASLLHTEVRDCATLFQELKDSAADPGSTTAKAAAKGL